MSDFSPGGFSANSEAERRVAAELEARKRRMLLEVASAWSVAPSAASAVADAAAEVRAMGPKPAEVRSVSSPGGEKGVKPQRHSLIPVEALDKIAAMYGVGAGKYDEHNWRRGYEWSKSYDALHRHLNLFWGGEDIDEETGQPHLACAAFHVMTLLTFADTKPEFDDRPVR